jgi:alkanesulfonate monooxygenase SsuD/methylene tetrahydromethanopterin reductase-like flavin-dependent oxidoreductase (luciferase family)
VAGLGWNGEEYARYGVPFDDSFRVRREQSIEALEIIDQLWTSAAPVTYDGAHFHLRDVSFWPKPVASPRPPMWMGGSGPTVRKIVACYLDGWVPSSAQGAGLDAATYSEYLAEIVTMATAQGREPESLMPGLNISILLAESDRAALKQAEHLRARKAWAEMSAEEIRQRSLVVIGGPAECAEQLIRYVDAGARYLCIGISPITSAGSTIRSLTMLAEEVLPAVRERCRTLEG